MKGGGFGAMERCSAGAYLLGVMPQELVQVGGVAGGGGGAGRKAGVKQVPVLGH
jgi:hypothetical protein